MPQACCFREQAKFDFLLKMNQGSIAVLLADKVNMR